MTRAEEIRTAQLETLRMITKEEAAGILGVSPGQIDKLRQAGALKAVKAGKEWRYSQEEIRLFQQQAAGLDLSGPENMRKFARVRG